MSTFFSICVLTTAIAIGSVVWVDRSPFGRRALPWTAGVLLGISIFWILPEMAEDRGWTSTLAGVFGALLLLGLIDRYVYPICPFCAASRHSEEYGQATDFGRHAVTLGWPLLIFACVHTFFDGWTIALSQATSHSVAASALSWGASIHKLPESVAIGVLSSRLTSTRRLALGAVFLIQAVMTAGGLLAMLAGQIDTHLVEVSIFPACAFLLLFGLLTLHEEWRLNGRRSAMRAAVPGLVGSGLAALATAVLAR
jgi:zinc transporter ZupT